MRVWRMRTGISFSVTLSDRRRLEDLVKDRNAPQKHVWRARIVLLSAEGVGTNAIMRKIIVLANALLRDNRLWSPKAS